ncbi:hypothetical protein GMB86_07905 [Terrilactibacillus sp. BCM23-1]|uniref:Competence protein ComK n=1 Tax=Terrilactibacillus tamarindi TaxID=2599694 RepID=A0A6N8CP83_9BACI|nr:competence protein ComK [Terrilactibacillus tamarindi]MTT31932.1 hypothetical protein [Terrilactibacillus tamarindi]
MNHDKPTITLEQYIVNPSTMALLPTDGPYGYPWTLVLETNKQYRIQSHSLKIVDKSCHNFGSSYKSNKEHVNRVMGKIKMVPVCICKELDVYLFPLYSPKQIRKCIWLSLTQIDHYHNVDGGTTQVVFRNGYSLNVDINYYSFKTKIERAHKYRDSLAAMVKKYATDEYMILEKLTSILKGYFNSEQI